MSFDDEESEKLAAGFRPAWEASEATDIDISPPPHDARDAPTLIAEVHPSVFEAATVQVPPELDKERTLERVRAVFPKEEITLQAAAAVSMVAEPTDNTLTLKPTTVPIAVQPMRPPLATIPTDTIARPAPTFGANEPEISRVPSDADLVVPKRSGASIVAFAILGLVALIGVGVVTKIAVLSPKIASAPNDSARASIAAQTKANGDIPAPPLDVVETAAASSSASAFASSSAPASPSAAVVASHASYEASTSSKMTSATKSHAAVSTSHTATHSAAQKNPPANKGGAGGIVRETPF